jgi:DNA-binding transcriptional LysR family regulator
LTTSKTTGWIDRIGRRLKLRDLHIFHAVAAHKNMARTATSLGVSRPVVSKSIADLERTLGAHLVDRNRDGVELTVFGRSLFKWSTVVFDDIRLGVKEIEFLAEPGFGEIRVGCPEVIAASLMPVIISRLSNKYPHATVQVVHTAQVDSNSMLFQQLRDRSIDVFLGRIPPRFSEDDLVADILVHDRMFVAAGANSHWARRRKSTWRNSLTRNGSFLRQTMS